MKLLTYVLYLNEIMTRKNNLRIIPFALIALFSCTSKDADDYIFKNNKPSELYLTVLKDSINITSRYVSVVGLGKDAQKLFPTMDLTDTFFVLPFNLNQDSVTYVLNDKMGVKDTFTLAYARQLISGNHYFNQSIDSVKIKTLSSRMDTGKSLLHYYYYYNFALKLERK